MIACLPMYDWPEERATIDALWSAIRKALVAAGVPAPAGLTRSDNLWALWQDPALVLGQTCGLPFRTRLHPSVSLVGALDYGLPDAPPGYYYSEIVVRADQPGTFTDFLDRRLAINEFVSQSGWASIQNMALAQRAGFSAALPTGAHRHSAEAVASGHADIAAIDAVTWRLIRRHQPALAAGLRSLGRTPPTPGLPLITAQRETETIAAAVAAAIA
ncbi:MAG: PhnD/SsuA/transferrin family substrate-binding protein, partial [Rhodobacteraceae bacterium]|nr:PhnD/SsuA/transferrin family substrate-binding protein [Paracoccaceae bacterium]